MHPQEWHIRPHSARDGRSGGGNFGSDNDDGGVAFGRDGRCGFGGSSSPTQILPPLPHALLWRRTLGTGAMATGDGCLTWELLGFQFFFLPIFLFAGGWHNIPHAEIPFLCAVVQLTCENCYFYRHMRCRRLPHPPMKI